METFLKNLFIVLVIAFFSACGPNAEQKAAMEKQKQDSIAAVEKAKQEAERAKMDSVANATKLQIEAKNSLEKNISELKETKTKMESSLVQAKADLAAQRSVMGSIQGFHFGRTSGEKAEAVRQQTVVIENCQQKIIQIQASVDSCAMQLRNLTPNP